jgi:hypothetical protein
VKNKKAATKRFAAFFTSAFDHDNLLAKPKLRQYWPTADCSVNMQAY